jgi:hypothetical protein
MPHDPPCETSAAESLNRVKRDYLTVSAATDLLCESRRDPEVGQAADGLSLGDQIAGGQDRFGAWGHGEPEVKPRCLADSTSAGGRSGASNR